MNNPIQLHDIDVAKFISKLDQCKGNVFLVSQEGDRLNLKSKLCQIMGLAKLIEGGKIADAAVICENSDDETMLFRFNLYGDDKK